MEIPAGGSPNMKSENKILRFFAAVMWENSLRQFEKIKNFTSFISG